MFRRPLKSKFGRLFNVVQIARPREGEVVFLTWDEWNWIRAQKLSSEKFDEILRARYQSHFSRIIPDSFAEERRQTALKYCGEILADIQKRTKKTG